MMWPSKYSEAVAAILLLWSPSLFTVKAEIQLTGLTVQLNDIHYYVPPHPVGHIAGNRSKTSLIDAGLLPITVLSAPNDGIDKQHWIDTFANFSRLDDVFQDGFLDGMNARIKTHESRTLKYLNLLPGNHNITILPSRSSQNWRFCNRALTDCAAVQPAVITNTSAAIPDGPYFFSPHGSIFQAFRLYSDTQGAFSETVVSQDGQNFSVLPANLPGQSLAVAVPSRLYYKPTADKPLAGVRLGVKDIYDLRGMKTSNGNRAWYSFYKAANESATAVQNLIDAGAIVVGKLKTSQFANGETATADWVDYHSPFNPRGDGYQDGSSSSTGPASAEASYPWLDITLGSDTGGSIRSPSQVQGIYGNRPSHGLVSMKGAVPLAPQFDTAGIFAREPRLWATAAKALYQANVTLQNNYPSSVLTVGLPNNASIELNSVLSQFLRNLTSFLSANVTSYDVEASWKADHPAEQPLAVLLNQTYELVSAKEQANRVRDKFYSDYAGLNDGRLPHVNPSPLQRWRYGDNATTTIEKAIDVKTRFMNWFNEMVLPRNSATCSKHLLIYARSPKPVYRDTYLPGPSRPMPFSTTRLSVYSGAPDMVVPIGEVSYHSVVTNHKEVMPVTVDIMAAKGCDGMIFSLVNDLHAAKLIPSVKTGRSLVNGGDILL
ncbi:hypothetical protein QQS21_006816 [Conoideocrella luteorostrata]|uniref:Amidase domain-containing protein n=1 Tax=Conoideocrella luteorostrata TaxID=1105319 RepID=A0AAJ0CR87_9HYPO|nr:hypothetical protein QQS21_006816 [Conoideocrella luteorostrata]